MPILHYFIGVVLMALTGVVGYLLGFDDGVVHEINRVKKVLKQAKKEALCD